MLERNRLKQLRLEHNMSQEQLAVVADCNIATISRYESGITKRLNTETLQNLADFFGVSIAYLQKIPDTGTEIIENIPVVEEILPDNQCIISLYKSNIETAAEVKKGLKKFFYRVQDDALDPVIEKKDLILINEELDVKDKAIVLVKYGEEENILLRMIRYDSQTQGAVLLPFYNKKYPPVILTEDNHTIIGVAESYTKSFKEDTES